MTLRERIARRLFGDIIEQTTQDALAAVSIRIDDSPGWDSLTQRGPADRPWAERKNDLDDALTAWRKNFFVRRIVTLTRSYVIGGGITISSKDPDVNQFIATFWNHPKNRIDRRLAPICDELTRTGELFPVLFTNKVDGMSYIRFVPASQIREVETDEEDYETELRYGQAQKTIAEPKWWIGPDHPSAYKTRYNKLQPLMLHMAVNRPIGATRGEGDLGPVLPWAKRYSEWLKDRVRLNRQRTRQGMLDIEIADNTMVEEKRRQLRRTNPVEAGIYVHGPGETTSMHSLQIRADDAEPDGKALRLAIATAANVALFYLGEGESVNYATAREMGEPTTRFYSERQTDVRDFLTDLVTVAYHRRAAILETSVPDDLQISTSVTEVARADNQGLAAAARDIAQALVILRDHGWIDDQNAVRLAFKFAGEPLGEDEIRHILTTDDLQLTIED